MSLKKLNTALIILAIILGGKAKAQFTVAGTDSWKTVLEKKSGNVSVLWYQIEPFIYLNDKDELAGVEYDLMLGFKGFLRQRYGINLKIDWVDAKKFEIIFPYIAASNQPGLFGLSFYSITSERKQHVKFSPPYMPDLNILVTSNNLPVYETDKEFTSALPGLRGFTMQQTTMATDLKNLRSAYYPAMQISDKHGNYEVIRKIGEADNALGYVPVSMYVMGLQKGLKVKRQPIMGVRREGFAAIFTKSSDWDEPVNEYFNSSECKVLVTGLIRRYLGSEVADIILHVSASDTYEGASTDIELLTKEREIVTKRLIDTALDAEKSKTQRNIFLLVGVAVLAIAGISYSRYRTKNRLSKLLQVRNNVIARQKEKMDQLNKRLNMKILQSKLNPHFLFNSLNTVQYYVGGNDKKAALQYIKRFSDFLRKVLQSGDDILITVPEEADLADQYLWLEQNRFPGRFHYDVDVVNGAAETATPPMLIHSILQEALYTNIINAGEGEKYYLKVKFIRSQDHLCVQVRDNGPGQDEENDRPRQNGLQANNKDILTQRLKVINSSALQPIVLNYSRSNNENIVELKIAQPLFNS